MTEKDARVLWVLIGSTQNEHVEAVANRLGNGRRPGTVITINPAEVLRRASTTYPNVRQFITVPETVVNDLVRRHTDLTIERALRDDAHLRHQYRLLFIGFPTSQKQAETLIQMIRTKGFDRHDRHHKVRIIHLRSPEVPRGIIESLNLLSTTGWKDRIIEIDATKPAKEVLAALSNG